MGSTLVAQGCADKVSTQALQAGDILVYDEGTPWGHIALYLGNNLLFEENAAYPPATKAANGTYTSRIGTYRPATYVYRMKLQYYNNNNEKGKNMRKAWSDGKSIYWFSDEYWGVYPNADALQIDINSGSVELPILDYSNRTAPWDARIKETRKQLY
jgi:cell wall-associated NlpC family hydrolase